MRIKIKYNSFAWLPVKCDKCGYWVWLERYDHYPLEITAYTHRDAYNRCKKCEEVIRSVVIDTAEKNGIITSKSMFEMLQDGSAFKNLSKGLKREVKQ